MHAFSKVIIEQITNFQDKLLLWLKNCYILNLGDTY